jgi:hypothetical protein
MKLFNGHMWQKYWVVLLSLTIFFVLRIVVVTIWGYPTVNIADATSYHGYATAILQKGDWLTNPDFYGAFRAPLYPLFVAAVYKIFGLANLLAVYVLQAFISTLTCLYIYKLSRNIFDERVAVLSLIWAGFYIYYLEYIRILMAETFVFFMLIFFFYYLYQHLSNERRISKSFWLSLISYSLLIHMDPRYLFYLPFLLVLFVIYGSFKRVMSNYVVFLVLTIVLLVPWTIRNYLAYGGFVLINVKTLDMRDTQSRNPTIERQIRNNVLNFGVINWTAEKSYPSQEERNQIKSGLNPNSRTPEEIDAIKNDVYPDSTFLKRKCFQFKEFWRPFRFGYAYRPFPDCRFVYWSTRHNLMSILSYGLLLPFMLYGLVDLLLGRKRMFWFLIFPLFIQTFLHVLQWALTRYRNPIDSFVIILASYGFLQIYTSLRKRS